MSPGGKCFSLYKSMQVFKRVYLFITMSVCRHLMEVVTIYTLPSLFAMKLISMMLFCKLYLASFNINDSTSSPISTRYPNNSSLNSFGLYVNYKNKIIEDVFFQSGVRYSSTILEADLSQNNTYYDFQFENTRLKNGAFVGGIGLSWVRNIYNNWKFNINTAFRSPNIDDLAKVFDSEPGNVVVPNPNLKPERSFGIEFGGYFRTKNNIELDFSTYITYLYNSLLRDDFTLNLGTGGRFCR